MWSLHTLADYFQFGETFEHRTDFAMFWVSLISLICLIGITWTMIHFCTKYSRKNNQNPVDIADDHILETIWTVVPTIIVMWFFWLGWEGYKTYREVPKDSMVIQVKAFKWGWNFTYPNGKVSDEPYIPVGTSVKFILKTEDVVHSFYLPEFRVKRDAMPGYEHYVWIKPQKTGKFNIYCTEYCGLEHWNMNRKLYVIEKNEYELWLKKAPEARQGDAIYKQMCASCHSVDGKAGVGPSFKGIKDRPTKLVGGKSVVANEEYLKNAILKPADDIVEGFANGMPSFEGKLNDKELKNIIEFLNKQQ